MIDPPLVAAFALALKFKKITAVLIVLTAIGIWHEASLPPYCAAAAHRTEWRCTDGTKATSAVDLAAPVVGDYTPTSWAQALLGDLGDAATAADVQAITAWERAEGGHWSNSARFNPLNTTEREPGSWPMNPVGVQAYPNWAEGFAATLATLRNGRYGGILAALAAGNCAPCVADAVGASPWGTGRFEV